MKEINEELEDFYESYDDSKKSKLRILFDDFGVTAEDYAGMKLSDIKPVYSTKKVIIHQPKSSSNENSLF